MSDPTSMNFVREVDRTSDIRISESEHRPEDDRRYTYIPTYILRGFTELHLEFSPVGGATR